MAELRFLRTMFFFPVLMKNNSNNNQKEKQNSTHKDVIAHCYSPLSIIKAKTKNITENIIPKMILGKSTNLGEISKPKTCVRIINLPISSDIRESFSLCFLVNFIENILSQIKIFVNPALSEKTLRKSGVNPVRNFGHNNVVAELARQKRKPSKLGNYNSTIIGISNGVSGRNLRKKKTDGAVYSICFQKNEKRILI